MRAGPAGLIERWRKFVEEVERGYKSGLEDYRKELDIRGILAMLDVARAPGLPRRESSRRLLQDLDNRLEATLIARDKRVWESSAADPFWDFGYPRNACNRFMEDIRKEGLAP